jgi:TolA-binding protein
VANLEAANVAAADVEQELRDQVESLNGHISDLGGAVQEQQEHIADLESAVAVLDDRETELDDREADLDEREQGLDDRAADLDERGQGLDDREAAITDAENEIEENTIPGDGIWLVGDDISPGVYQAQGSGSACYWARLNSSDGFDINDNHFGSASVSVEIRSSDWAFETSGCGSWKKR